MAVTTTIQLAVKAALVLKSKFTCYCKSTDCEHDKSTLHANMLGLRTDSSVLNDVEMDHTGRVDGRTGSRTRKWEHPTTGHTNIINLNNQVGEWLRRCLPVYYPDHERGTAQKQGGVQRTHAYAPLFAVKTAKGGGGRTKNTNNGGKNGRKKKGGKKGAGRR
jgi:hypothetical protein